MIVMKIFDTVSLTIVFQSLLDLLYCATTSEVGYTPKRLFPKFKTYSIICQKLHQGFDDTCIHDKLNLR